MIDAKTDVADHISRLPKEEKRKTGMHVFKDATNSSFDQHLSTASGSLHILKQTLTDSISWTPIFQKQLLPTAYIHSILQKKGIK